MSNERGWKDGVYNPGFTPDRAYIERKAKELAASGIEFPKVKGVCFKRRKAKALRNVVTRVVMVGFDPFNNSGLPEHIERQLVDDFYFWYNDYAMRLEFQKLELQLDEARKTATIDPYLQDLFDRGLVNQNQLDMVTLLRGKPMDLHSNIFSFPETIEDGPYIFSERDFKRLQAEGYITSDGNVDLGKAFTVPVGDMAVVPPDRMVPMYVPGSMDRLRHYEEGALERSVKKSSMTPEQQAALDAALPTLTPVFKDGEFLPAVTGAFAVGADGVKRDLRDIDFMGIALGTSGPVEGEHIDGEVERALQKSGLMRPQGGIDIFKVAALAKRDVTIEGEVVSPVMALDEDLDRRNYGIPIHQYLDGDGNVQYQVGELNEKPLEGQIVDKGVLITVLGPEDGAWQAGKEELSQAIENGELNSPPFVPKQGDGYKLDHIAKLPPATGAKPLVQQFHEITKQTSQGRGRDETMAIYHEYHMGLEALEEQIVESRSAGPSLLPKPDITAGEVGDASRDNQKLRDRSVGSLVRMYGEHPRRGEPFRVLPEGHPESSDVPPNMFAHLPVGRSEMSSGYNKHEDERGHNEALGLFTRTRPNPLREHWEKHGDPYEGRLPPYTNAEVLKEILDQNHDPELAAKVKQRMMEGLGDLEDTSDAGLPPVNPTPEEIADQEAAMQEAAEGKLDYLLEGTQWDPKLRK